jgi:hypothetical protein
MRIKTLLLALSLALVWSLPAAAGVEVDWDNEVDFSQYKTYAWMDGTPVPNQLMQRRIEAALEAELEGKGLTKATGTPDLYVVSHGSLDEEKSIHSSSFGYAGGPGRRGYRGWGRGRGSMTTTARVTEVEIGNLVVDLVDAGKDELVWRAVGSGTLKKPEKMEKVIPKAAKKMFKKYPVSE